MELLKMLLDIRFLLGFIKNGVFPPKLTAEEEERYVKELDDPATHEEARRQLIEHNLRLVAHIVKKYDNTRELGDDLISIGTIGLIKAVDSFHGSKNVKIATYAAKCIENEILMTLRSSKRYSKDTLLFDTIGVDKDGEDLTLIDILENDEVSVTERVDKEERIAKLRKYLSVLDDRELEIISYRYGLNDFPELTQKEVAKKYKISRSYVSRIEKRALFKLLQEFNKENLVR